MTENTQLYEHAEKISHFSKFLEDLVAGSCCGVAICLSSHPFDTVKVRMQIHGSGKLYNEIMKIFRAEGPLAFYQGMSYPLYTQPLVNAIVFAAYEFFKRFTKIAEDQELNLKQGLMAGMFAGFVNSWVVGPIELVKCRMQLQNYKHQTFVAPIDVLKDLLAKEGYRGLFRGNFSTIARETFAYAAQFATYEELKQLFTNLNGGQKLSSLQALATGGAAGFACWLFSYPQDTIKTRLQCVMDLAECRNIYPPNAYIKDGGFFSCARDLINKGGYKSLFYGFQSCIFRAVVGNAIGIAAYEKVQHLFHAYRSRKH